MDRAANESLRIMMPTDVFPPVCGGAGWSAHALARALQDRGHQVVAIVPRPVRRAGPSLRLAVPEIGDVLGVATVAVPYVAPRLPVLANWYRHEWLWPLMRNVIVREVLRREPLGGERRTVIHAQHVQTVPPAVLAGEELGLAVVATVRDHWPRDYFATGLHGGRMPYPRTTAASLLTDLIARRGAAAGLLASLTIPYMLGHLRRRQYFLARADAVVAVSRYVARFLPASVAPERVHVIPNIVDVDAVEQLVQTPSSDPVPGPFLLYVGKLERNKGVHLLPAVMAAAQEALGGKALPLLVVAGSGSLAGLLERDLAALGLAVRILPGWTAHDEVLRLMHHAEVLLFPSAWGEPLSRVLLEAGAAGACVAAMATGGTPEVITDGVNGVLAVDAPALGRKVAGLLEDPQRRAALRAAARRRAHERFAPAAVAVQFEDLYRQALRERIGGSRSGRA